MARHPLAPTLLGLIAVLGAGFVPTRAQADETHYQSVFIGDRAFGMGGAATGLAADTSSTFYNPGALAELPNHSFSASLGLTAFERTRVHNGVRGPATEADLGQTGSRSLPVFSAALLRFGERGSDGLKRHAIAFSTIYPASTDLTLRVDLLHPDTGIPSTVRVEHGYRQTLYGLSYALHVSGEVAFGITAFLATQRLTHRETLFVADGGTPTPDGGFTGVESHTALTTVNGRSFALLPRFGLFYRPNPKLSLGLAFQPPAIPIHSRASLSQRSSFAAVDATTGVTTTYFDLVEQRRLRVRMPMPGMVRLGLGYHASDSLTLAFDVSLHGAVRARRLLPGADQAALERAPFLPVDTRRLPTFDAAAGLEWVMRDGVTWRMGAFTNRSAAPRIRATADQYRLERVDHYGASFGLGVHVGPYHLTFGVAGSRGRGSALSVYADPLSTSAYARTRIEERVLYLFVTGATRSVARLARSALHRVQNRDGRPETDDDDDREERALDAVEAEQQRARERERQRRLRRQQARERQQEEDAARRERRGAAPERTREEAAPPMTPAPAPATEPLFTPVPVPESAPPELEP